MINWIYETRLFICYPHLLHFPITHIPVGLAIGALMATPAMELILFAVGSIIGCNKGGQNYEPFHHCLRIVHGCGHYPSMSCGL